MAQKKKKSRLDVLVNDYMNASGTEREKLQKIFMANYKLFFKSEPITDDWQIVFSMMDKFVAEVKKVNEMNKDVATNFKSVYEEILKAYAKEPEARDKETLLAGVRKVLEMNRNLNDAIANMDAIFLDATKEIIKPHVNTDVNLAKNLADGLHTLRLAFVDIPRDEKKDLLEKNFLSTIRSSPLSDYRKRKVRESLRAIENWGGIYLNKLENAKSRTRSNNRLNEVKNRLLNPDDFGYEEYEDDTSDLLTQNRKLQRNLNNMSSKNPVDDDLSPDLTHNQRRLAQLNQVSNRAPQVDLSTQSDELETLNRKRQRNLQNLRDDLEVVDAFRPALTKNQRRMNLLNSIPVNIPPRQQTHNTSDDSNNNSKDNGDTNDIDFDDNTTSADNDTNDKDYGANKWDTSDFDAMVRSLQYEFNELEKNPNRPNPGDLKPVKLPFERIGRR